MKLTKAQKDLLKYLSGFSSETLLHASECRVAINLKIKGMARHHGYNHYTITEAGRAALKEMGE